MGKVPTTDLTARAIKNGLDTVVMGCRVRSYSTVGSTMDAARRLAELGCAEGTLIVAADVGSGSVQPTVGIAAGNQPHLLHCAAAIARTPARHEHGGYRGPSEVH
jgi:hypothetical protein